MFFPQNNLGLIAKEKHFLSYMYMYVNVCYLIHKMKISCKDIPDSDTSALISDH